MKVLMVVLAAVGLLVGCENDNSSTVTNEAPKDEINIPTTGTVTMATINTTGNQNTTIVYLETTPGMTQVYEVNTVGNSNLLGFFSSGPVVPPPPPPTDPETP